MAGITQSDLSNILEKIIRPAVEDQLYAKTILWNMFGGYKADADTKAKAMPRLNMGVLKTSLDNQSFYIPILTGHSSGAVAIAESGTLNPGKPQLQQAEISARYQTGTFQITKQTLAIKDAGVAVKQLDFYMKENALAMVLDLNRQGWGAGNALLGTANGAGTSSTALTFNNSTNGDIDYTVYTPVGTNIKIGSNSYVTVTAITGVNQVTISSAQSWSANANIYKCDGNGNVATELDGLGEAISASAVYQGIDPSSVPSWKAYVDATGGSLATVGIKPMSKAFLAVNKFGNVKYVIMNQSLFNSYGSNLTTQIRFQYKDVLGGGWKGLDFMGGNADVVLDYDCPDANINYLSPEYATLAELSPFEWEKGNQGVLLRIQGTLNYEAVATWFGNFGIFKRSAFGVQTGMTP